MSKEIYMTQDLEKPTFFFHGSPKKLEIVEMRQANDSNGNLDNIDNAVFVTSSFLVASAYSFKDTIKANSQDLKWSFSINNDGKLPIMMMKNVNIDSNIKGYIYVFKNDGSFKKCSTGSLQYKSYFDLKPIDVVEINFCDFMQYYEVDD